MREFLLRRYVDADHMYEIIGHDHWLYIGTALKYGGIALLLALIYIFAIAPMQQGFLQAIWAILGVVVYLKCLYDIFDEYLDVLIVTDKGLIHFSRDGLWKQKADILQRVSIESVSSTQDTFLDSIIKKGDLQIKLEDTITRFKDISHPSSVMNMILEYKDKILGRHNYMENEVGHEEDKYSLLVEALGEVVNEYVEKKKETSYY